MATAIFRSASTTFPLLSNRYQQISENIDHRSNGYKSWKESLLAKTDTAVLLVKEYKMPTSRLAMFS